MSKKNKHPERGTFALCITAGLIVGVGLGTIVGSPLFTTVAGGCLGAAAGYYFSHQKKRSRR